MTKDPKSTAHPGQLGLFDAPSPPPEAPEGAPSRMRALEQSQWQAPDPIYPREGRSAALAGACSIQNAELARQLLLLDVRWDLDEPYGPDHASAVSLLMRSPPSNGWRPADPEVDPDKEPVLDEASRVALAMVERGADFLRPDARGQSALSLAVHRRREAFVERLAGHPDFKAELLAGLRVGLLPSAPGDKTPPPDNRPTLVSHLVSSCQIHALKSVVTQGGCPLNELDPHGRLPIGYCRDPRMLDALLQLGADPKLEDAHGLNALARAQETSDTSVREKLITRIAQELKKSLKSDPGALAALQEQNIAALLEAAENAPKSSMLKTISSFKFDPTKARDPQTGMTPLMAALKGGRSASAAHLLHVGCDLNAVDAQGVSAGARLMSCPHTSTGPNPVDVAKHWAPKIDFSIHSSRGWPVAVEAAFLLGQGKANDSYSYHDTSIECFLGAINRRSDAQGDWLIGADGVSICEAFAQGKPTHYNSMARLKKLYELEARLLNPGSLDRAVAGAIIISANPKNGYQSHSGNQQVVEALQQIFRQNPQPMPRSSQALANALQSHPKEAGEFIRRFPALAAAIEAQEIAQASAPKASAKAAARL